jgi:hypothetical protein
MTTLARDFGDRNGGLTTIPLVVDLDGTLLKVDTLYERFPSGLSTKPAQTLLSLFMLRNGIAAFKHRFCNIALLAAYENLNES